MPQQSHTSTDSASQMGRNGATATPPYTTALPSTGFSAQDDWSGASAMQGRCSVSSLMTAVPLSQHTHSNTLSYHRQKRLGLDKCSLGRQPSTENCWTWAPSPLQGQVTFMPDICESLKTPPRAASDPENHPAGRLQAHIPIGSYSTRPMENHRIASQPGGPALPAWELLK